MRTAALTALLATLAVACAQDPPDAFAPLHQAAPQEIPGTFGYTLLPVDDVGATVDPVSAWRGLAGAHRGADVSVTLAEVSHPTESGWGPSWVFFTNDLCFFTAKGDYVSPSRAGEDDGCTPHNVLVQVVDASSGEFVGVFEAYDDDLAWLPERRGSPDQLPGATPFQ
jgi:hypothetical protein